MWPSCFRVSSSRLNCFSALTLGFFDVAHGQGDGPAWPLCFSALTLGFFDVARSSSVLASSLRASFSALTLGFFDVAAYFTRFLKLI